MNLAPSKRTRSRKTPNSFHTAPGFHWRHHYFRGPIDSVCNWLADVLMSSQALQATPEIVGYSAPGPTAVFLVNSGKDFSNSTRSAADTTQHVMEHRKCLQHRLDRVRKGRNFKGKFEIISSIFFFGLKTRRNCPRTNRSITNSPLPGFLP